MKNLFSILFIAAMGLLVSSCEKEILNSSSNFEEDQISLKGTDPGGCSSGRFTTDRGMLKFNDDREFEKTLNFLSCATDEDLETLRNSIPIETSQKAFLDFRASTMPDKINTAQELLAVEADFEGRVAVNIDADNQDRSYATTLEFFEEFATPDGLFMIGDDYLKVVDNSLYRLKNGTEQDARGITRDTKPTPEGGVGPEGPTITVTDVVITTRGDGDPNCCPYSDKFEKKYNSGKNKLQVEYKILNFSNQTGSTLALKLNLKVKASHDRRKSFGPFSYWGCDPTALGMGWTYELEYQPTGFLFTDSQSFPPVGNGCTFTQTPILAAKVFQDVPPFKFWEDLCFNQIVVEAVNGNNGVTVTGDCGEETNVNELNPKIVFYKYNEQYGNPMCSIGLDPAVGHLNFKDVDVCDNDDARSATLHEIPAGRTLRIFDSPSGSTNDDFLVIRTLRDVIYHEIDSFEEDFSNDDIVITYCCGGNLDGKVSSFRDF